MGVIYLLSDQPVLPGPQVFLWDFLFKKSAHMGVFAILFWLWMLVFNQVEKARGRKITTKWLWIFFFCLLYAMLDEYHQSFVLGRTATWRDVGFDSLGIAIAALFSARLI